jgi:hypothetical protein
MTLAPEARSLPLLICCSSNYIKLNGNDLTSGIPYKEKNIYIKIINGEPYHADIILAEPSLNPVISPKLADVIKEKKIQYGELIPIYEGFYKDYFVLNAIPLLDLVDEKKSTTLCVINRKNIYVNAYLKEYSGPDGIFRIKNYSVFPFVTEGMIQIIKQFDHKGITFRDGILANSAEYQKLMNKGRSVNRRSKGD